MNQQKRTARFLRELRSINPAAVILCGAGIGLILLFAYFG